MRKRKHNQLCLQCHSTSSFLFFLHLRLVIVLIYDRHFARMSTPNLEINRHNHRVTDTILLSPCVTMESFPKVDTFLLNFK